MHEHFYIIEVQINSNSINSSCGKWGKQKKSKDINQFQLLSSIVHIFDCRVAILNNLYCKLNLSLHAIALNANFQKGITNENNFVVHNNFIFMCLSVALNDFFYTGIFWL